MRSASARCASLFVGYSFSVPIASCGRIRLRTPSATTSSRQRANQTPFLNHNWPLWNRFRAIELLSLDDSTARADSTTPVNPCLVLTAKLVFSGGAPAGGRKERVGQNLRGWR